MIRKGCDVGRPFDAANDLSVVAATFKNIETIELSYREKSDDISIIYEDIRNTAMALATRGKVDINEDFGLLKEGGDKLKRHIFSGRFTLDNAITDAAKAAYLTTLIEHDASVIERYSGNPSELKDKVLPSVSKELAKFRRGNPEAFFYGIKTSELFM